jgi:sugar phosphate isomerase/epimerase
MTEAPFYDKLTSRIRADAGPYSAFNSGAQWERLVNEISRRQFVGATASIAIYSLAGSSAHATPLGLPLALQLYSVRKQMAEDLDNTFATVGAAGYTEVEAASLPKKSSKEIRTALDKAGLRCVGAHHGFADLHDRFDEIVAYDRELGVQFIICASPGYRTPPSAGAPAGPRPYSLDDYRYNADQFNAFGEKLTAAGLRFAYHNHTREFILTEGKTPYDLLMELTDPKKVTFELDCGWAFVAGVDPARIMKDHPYRISMLHIKDFNLPPNPSPEKPEEAKVTEMGRGNTDYRPVVAQAAKNQHIQHAFVEQEAFDMPWKESLQIDADFMRNFKP